MSAPPTSILALLSRMSATRLEALFAQDAGSAARWVYAAAADGLPQAQVCYGRLLLNGTGLAKDAVAALKWFRRAAASGDIDALNMVGCCLDNGWGTTPNPPAAAAAYRRAADAGHAWAQYNLGHLYLDGRGVVQDFDRAYYLLPACRRAASRTCHEPGGAVLRGRMGNTARPASSGALVSALGRRRLFPWAIQLGHSVLIKQGRFDEAAIWFERAATGGSTAVRQAVLDAITAVGSVRIPQSPRRTPADRAWVSDVAANSEVIERVSARHRARRA